MSLRQFPRHTFSLLPLLIAGVSCSRDSDEALRRARVTEKQAILNRAHEIEIQSDLKSIVMTAELVRSLNDNYPESLQDLQKMMKEETLGPLHPRRLQDPFGHPYQLEIIDDEPVARCLGQDGKVGGEGENRDRVYPGP